MKESAPNQHAVTGRNMRAMLLVASLLVFLIGTSLYFLPRQTDIYFSWTIGSPFTAAFLGGAYLAATVLEFIAARERLWANARVAVPAVLLFTALTLIVTLLHLDKFHFDSPRWITLAGTWVWLLVYLTVPVILALLWIGQARRGGNDPPRAAPMPPWARLILVLQAIVLLVPGALLLLAPMVLAPVWAWPITPLTGRAIGAWGLGVGTAALHAALENDWRRGRPGWAGVFVFGLLQLVNLARFGDEFAWGSAAGLMYVALIVSLALLGGYGLFRQQPS